MRTRGNLRSTCCHSLATRRIAERQDRVRGGTKRLQACGQENGRQEKSWLTDAARRYEPENARLLFDGADRRGLAGEPIAGSLLAARRGVSRFQNGSSSREDAGRALVGNFLFGF